jgi:hypothetical protein
LFWEFSIMRSILVATAMFAAVVSVYACSDKHDDGHNHNVPTDPDGGHTSPYPSCNAITQQCHKFDIGEGAIHDCHELAHAATSDAPCAAEKTKCLALCVDEAGTDSGIADATGQ